jgi:SAM-dependent methyltransferase
VRQAREQARRQGAAADFRVGDLAATGLDAGSADAVLCVDAIHFAPQPGAAYGEIRRILTSGGCAVLTNWEPLEWDDQRLPSRLRRVDLGRDWPRPGSRPSRSATAPAGGPASAPCGRKPRRSTPVMTRRCAHSTTRACAPGNLRSGPPGHGYRQRTVGHPHISFPSPAASEPAAGRDQLIELSRTRAFVRRGRWPLIS